MDSSTSGTTSARPLRLFLAIPLPEETVASIADISRRLQKGATFTPVRLTWSRPESMHLTLRFLGDTDESRVEAVARAAEVGCEVRGGFKIRPGRIDAMPSWRHPRVLCFDVEDSTGRLRELQSRLSEAMDAMGYEREERSFAPHLTLGRFKSARGAEMLRSIVREHSNLRVPGFRAESYRLYRSDLRPEGAVHSLVREYRLATRGAGEGNPGPGLEEEEERSPGRG